MLLRPRNWMEACCQKLKLNIDDTEPMKYFICDSWDCVRKERGNLLSTFKNKKCHCGKPMDREISLEERTSENGFVKETASFIICDDLRVMPNSLGTSVDLFHELGAKNMEAIEERTVEIGNKELLDLLKCSFLSKTPLTDFILNKKQFLYVYTKHQCQFEIGEVSSNVIRQMVLKVLIRKSDRKILFVEGQEDFADFIFGFLTLPLGGVLHMLGGFSSYSCLDKLYKSVTELCPYRYLMSPSLKHMLVNPQCAPQFGIYNQILQIGDLPVFYCKSYEKDMKQISVLVNSTKSLRLYGELYKTMDIVDPKSSDGKSNSGGCDRTSNVHGDG
ncbi:hypothetical protein GLYMA_18G195000v4 [Glycine max]|nr:hypothetical protein GLYMA_18G195000v4 [Glycine max]